MNIRKDSLMFKQHPYKNDLLNICDLNYANNQLSTIDTSTNNKSVNNKNYEMFWQGKNSKKVHDKNKHNENRREFDIASIKIKGSNIENSSKIKLKKRNTNVLNLDIINHYCAKNNRNSNVMIKNINNKSIQKEESTFVGKQRIYTIENERGSNNKEHKSNGKINDGFIDMEDNGDKMKMVHKQTEPNDKLKECNNNGLTYEKNLNKMYFSKIHNNNGEGSNEIVLNTQNEMHKNFDIMRMRRKVFLEQKQNVLKNTKKNVIALFYNSTNTQNIRDDTTTQINFDISSSDSNDEADKLIFSQIHKNFDEQQKHNISGKVKQLQISKEICFDVCSPPVTSSTSTAIHLTSSNPPKNQLSSTSHSKTLSHIPVLKFKKLNSSTTTSSNIIKPEYNMHITTSNNNRYGFSNSLHKSMNFAIASIISSHSKPKSKSHNKSTSKPKRNGRKNKSINHGHKASSSFSRSTSHHQKNSNLKVILPPHKDNNSQIKLLLQLNSTTSLNKKSKSFRFFTPQHFQSGDNKSNTVTILNTLHYFRFDEKEDTIKQITKSIHSTFMIYISYEYNLFYFVGLYFVDNKNEMLVKLTPRNKHSIPDKIKFQNINMCYLCKENSLMNLIAKSVHLINENECIVFFKKNLSFN